jgi:coniferyl-aldehyde dehydrogenase
MNSAEILPTPSAASTTTEAHADLSATLERMRAALKKDGPPTYEKRIEQLDTLKKALVEQKHVLAKAVSEDFGGRSHYETFSAEVMFLVTEIDHVREHLHEWMETEPRDVAWMFLPAKAEVVMQPVGVVGVLAPWNYPIQLCLSPLINALAAGNRVMIKPSEVAPRIAEELRKFIEALFSPEVATVVTGGVDVAEAFTRLPFDHLVFTGSTRLGKVVMRAAAENLVPVTLELGGKSPAVVAEGYSIEDAAKKIMFGKCFNAGQTCVAPDYALVPRARMDAFVEACRAAVTSMYPDLGKGDDYTSIVSDAHFARLKGYLEDARARGANVIDLASTGGSDATKRRLPPALVLEATDAMHVMQEEIFGPILPVFPYDTLDEAIAQINARPRPLALYYFDSKQARIDHVLRETTSGGVSINDVMLHAIQADLPFGGTGASGIGAYHGREGFDTFTKKKPVFYQARLSAVPVLRPPYGGRADFVLRTIVGK